MNKFTLLFKILPLHAVLAMLALTSGPARAQGPSVQSLSPERALELAAERNASLRAAILAAKSARLEVRGEEARYVLTLFGDAQAARSEQPSYARTGLSLNGQDGVDASLGVRRHLLWGTDLSLTFDAARVENRLHTYDPSDTSTFGPAFSGGARLLLVQPLLRGFGTEVNRAPLYQAEARRDLAELSRDATASAIAKGVLTAYWEAWYAAESVRIAESSLALAEELWKNAARRAELGSLSLVDVLPFETRVSTQREELAAASAELRRRNEDLGRLIGLDAPGSELTLEVAWPPAPGAREGDPLAMAMGASPAVREATAQVEVAKAQLYGAGEASRARLDLQGWVEARSAADTFPRLAGDGADGVGGGVGVSLEVPLDADLSRTTQARARLGVASAEQQLIVARRDVAAQTAAQAAQEEASRKRVEISQKTISIAERQLAAQQTRLKTGTVITADVLAAQEEVRAAKQRNARASVDLVNASVSLDDLTGLLLSRHAHLFEEEGR